MKSVITAASSFRRKIIGIFIEIRKARNFPETIAQTCNTDGHSLAAILEKCSKIYLRKSEEIFKRNFLRNKKLTGS